MKKFCQLFCLAALFSAVALSPAFAVEVASLFTAQVPFDQNQVDARERAYEVALAEVLLRVSGSELVSDADLFAALFPQPVDYVVQFRPGPEDTMFVSFDGDAVEEVLRRSGQTVWGSDRPLTLVWLAVDWGRGQREIIGSTDVERSRDAGRSIDRNRQLRQRVLDFADRRGLPVMFPLLDAEDLEQVSFSDIWGGFNERLVEASERYDVDSVLIGRVDASGSRRNRWTYYFGPEELSWNGEPEVIIMHIADMLAAEFAISADAPIRTVDLDVFGITSVDAYGEVQSLLTGVNVIDSYSITEVAGDRIRFEVNAHGGADRLARALRFAGLIEQERIDMGDFGFDSALSSLEFFYEP